MVFATLLSVMSPLALAGPELLMLGNSYTFQQNLDQVIEGVFTAAGDEATTSTLTSGGLALPDHLERAEAPGTAWHDTLTVDQSPLGWVVLQDQSQIPSFEATNSYRVESARAADGLNEIIANRDGETLFFLTWGRRDGDVGNIERNPDFETMQENLTNGYLSYVKRTTTDERPTWVAPVGLGFAAVHQSILDEGGDPLDAGSLFNRLYSNDGSHPSFLGAYLAACVFYSTITGESAVGLAPPPELSGGEDTALATALQEASHEAVFGSLELIDYPWEGSGVIDSGSDSGETGGGDSGSDDTGGDVEEGGGCGCSSGGGSGGLWVALLGGLAIRRRRA